MYKTQRVESRYWYGILVQKKTKSKTTYSLTQQATKAHEHHWNPKENDSVKKLQHPVSTVRVLTRPLTNYTPKTDQNKAHTRSLRMYWNQINFPSPSSHSWSGICNPDHASHHPITVDSAPCIIFLHHIPKSYFQNEESLSGRAISRLSRDSAWWKRVELGSLEGVVGSLWVP